MTSAADLMAAKEAEASYRQGERRLRRRALTALKSGKRGEANDLLNLAHQVGMEFVRNHIGRKPDQWELPPTEVMT